jgi:hypothetical protein
MGSAVAALAIGWVIYRVPQAIFAAPGVQVVRGQLPDLLHAFAFALILYLAGRGTIKVERACACWCLIEMLCEIVQHPIVAHRLLSMAEPYRNRLPSLLYAYLGSGTFDVLDLSAYAIGCLAAWKTVKLIETTSPVRSG